MKQTRKIGISDKVFTIENIRWIAAIFDEQATLAKNSDERSLAEYSIRFSDDTTIESDSPDLFSEESFAIPARPVAIRMSFRSYKLDRHISLSLDQGDPPFGNEAAVSGEREWVAQSFLRLKETLDTVRPQSVWLRKHKTLLLNLIAVGIGTLVVSAIDLLVATFLIYGIHLSELIKPLPPDSPWRELVSNAVPFLYLMKWFWRWAAGFFFGAFALREWLLSMWPSIEFDFGLAHLQTERIRRKRLVAILSLIVLPVVVNVIYDIVKSLRAAG